MTDQLPPGPELDAEVATGLMGWRKPTLKPDSRVWIEGDLPGKHRYIEVDSFDPSTDHAAAELVKAKLVEMGWCVFIARYRLKVQCGSQGVGGDAAMSRCVYQMSFKRSLMTAVRESVHASGDCSASIAPSACLTATSAKDAQAKGYPSPSQGHDSIHSDPSSRLLTRNTSPSCSLVICCQLATLVLQGFPQISIFGDRIDGVANLVKVRAVEHAIKSHVFGRCCSVLITHDHGRAIDARNLTGCNSVRSADRVSVGQHCNRRDSLSGFESADNRCQLRFARHFVGGCVSHVPIIHIGCVNATELGRDFGILFPLACLGLTAFLAGLPPRGLVFRGRGIARNQPFASRLDRTRHTPLDAVAADELLGYAPA